MPKKKPQFMIIYQCLKCGFDFGLTELDKPQCFYCDSTDQYIEIERKNLTPKAIADRLKQSTDRMMENLKKAYQNRPKEKANDSKDDSEKMLLDILVKTQKLQKDIKSLKLSKKKISNI